MSKEDYKNSIDKAEKFVLLVFLPCMMLATAIVAYAVCG